MLKTSLTAILAFTIVTGSLALADNQDDSQESSAPTSTENSSGLPKENREFNIGMPPAATAGSFGVEREMKESGEKGGTDECPAAAEAKGYCKPDTPKTMKAPGGGSSAFGVEREMKESGEKGGSE